MDSDNEHIFDVRQVHGKGKGLFVNVPVPKSTCVLSEVPILTLPSSLSPEDVKTEVDNLPEQQRQAFESLLNCHPYENIATKYMGIVKTNCIGQPDGHWVRICMYASRINHSCDANAQHTWNDKLGKIVVHALKDIARDEEVTINYVGREHTRQERQEHLKQSDNFECACGLCSLHLGLSDADDRKVLRTRKLWASLDRNAVDEISRHLPNPLKRLRRLEEIALNRAVMSSCTMYETYMEVLNLCLSHSDLARGKIFLQRAHSSYVLEHGDHADLPSGLQTCLQNLASSACFGQSTRWQTGEDDVLSESSPELFNNWLWRRENIQTKIGLFKDLRDRSTFLGIGGLPIEGLVDIEYHQDIPTGQASPKRHWCFMGEIREEPSLGVESLLMVEDVDRHITDVFFDDQHSGAELSGNAHQYHTIVVLYAQRGQVDDGTFVRVRDASMFKVRTFTLAPNGVQTKLTLRRPSHGSSSRC